MKKSRILDILKYAYNKFYEQEGKEVPQEIIDELYKRYKSAEELDKKINPIKQKKTKVDEVADRVVAVVLAYVHEDEFRKGEI